MSLSRGLCGVWGRAGGSTATGGASACPTIANRPLHPPSIRPRPHHPFSCVPCCCSPPSSLAQRREVQRGSQHAHAVGHLERRQQLRRRNVGLHAHLGEANLQRQRGGSGGGAACSGGKCTMLLLVCMAGGGTPCPHTPRGTQASTRARVGTCDICIYSHPHQRTTNPRTCDMRCRPQAASTARRTLNWRGERTSSPASARSDSSMGMARSICKGWGGGGVEDCY